MAETLSSRLNVPWYLASQILEHCYCVLTSFTSSAPLPPDSTHLELDHDKPCRFRTDTETSATVTLPDGRKLGYAEYGSMTGRPVFYAHGLPGARTEAAMWDHIGQNKNLRLIGIDRPGIGWSSPQANRKLLDFPKDVQFLAQHLGLGEYAVLGVSSGGPYALACAFVLPSEELKAVAVVIGLGSSDMHGWKNYLGWCACTYLPGLVKWYLKRDPAAQFQRSDGERYKTMREAFFRDLPNMPARDMECFRDNPDPLRLFVERTSKEIFGDSNLDGVIADGMVLGNDWGFRVEDVRADLPMQLWYGKQDTIAPVQHGELYAARLGGRALFRVEDETHGSMIQTWMPEVFETLAGSM